MTTAHNVVLQVPTHMRKRRAAMRAVVRGLVTGHYRRVDVSAPASDVSCAGRGGDVSTCGHK